MCDIDDVAFNQVGHVEVHAAAIPPAKHAVLQGKLLDHVVHFIYFDGVTNIERVDCKNEQCGFEYLGGCIFEDEG